MMTDTINTRELIMNILLEMDREKTPCHLAVRDALDKYQFPVSYTHLTLPTT